MTKIDEIEKLAHTFLIDWRTELLSPEENITEEIQSKLEEGNWIKID